MKKEIGSLVCVYKDEAHEEKTKIDLTKAQESLQSCLNVWVSLELTVCKDIFQLILNPQKAYATAVNELAEPPETFGRFAISKGAYINILEIPIPDSLYRAAREARKHQFTNLPELWDVMAGTTIVTNQDEAERLIDSQNIYVSDPAKVQLIKELQEFAKLANSINQKLSGDLLRPTPVTTEFCRGKFLIIDGYNNGLYQYKIAVDPAFLRQLV